MTGGYWPVRRGIGQGEAAQPCMPNEAAIAYKMTTESILLKPSSPR